MKIFSFFLFSILVVQLNAQLTFFVRPAINLKADVSSTDAFEFRDYVMDVSPYYKYDNIAFHSFFHGLDLSFSAGFKSKSKRYMLELGVSGDETQSGYKLNHFRAIPSSTHDVYFGSNVVYIYGRSFPRIFIQNSFRLKEFKNHSNLNLLLGFGFSSKNNDVLNISLGEIKETVKVEDNVYVERKSALYVLSLNNYFVHFGFSSEIHFKNKYLFDASLFYSHGFKEMSVVVTNLVTYNDANSTAVDRVYQSVSRGSGLYIQFSRQLQAYPWKKKNK